MGTRPDPTATVEMVLDGNGLLVLRVRGELDLSVRGGFEAAVIVACALAPTVVVDLAAVTFCDSYGLAMLLACAHEAGFHGTRLDVINAGPQLRRLLEITALEWLVRSGDIRTAGATR